MTDSELLKSVKNALGITDDFQNATLKIYIDECKCFLKSAGVSDKIINSKSAVGVICRGVTDLWDYGSGGGKLSDYFFQRAIQLVYESE